MKVLLLKEVKSLGKAGDICEVKDGYGKNFLIAKGMAQIATNETINKYKKEERIKKEKEEALIEELKQLESKLKNITLAFKEFHNIDIDKKALDLKNPIKSTGVYEIDLKLGFGIHAICKVDIQAQ